MSHFLAESIVLNVDKVVKQTELVEQIEIGLLQIKGQTLKRFILVDAQQSKDLLDLSTLLLKRLTKVFLNHKSPLRFFFLLELVLLKSDFISHISDHNDQLFLPIDLSFGLRQHNGAILRCVEHFYVKHS